MTTTAQKAAAKKTTTPAVQAPEPELTVDEALIEAQRERIALLEAQLAAQTEQEPVNEYTREEVYVAEGTGICLHCACEGFTRCPKATTRCAAWGCNHGFGEHRRNPAGAVWKDERPSISG